VKTLLITFVVGLCAITAAQAQQISAPVNDLMYQVANDLNSDEQALFDKGAIMEMFSPNEHSSHMITHIEAVKQGKKGKEHKMDNSEPVLCLVFGIEDATPAREEGKSMAEFRYSRSQAEQFLFAQAWDKYHDRFLTRAYVQEGEEAFNKALKKAK
jgi:hypothetical protein